MPEFRNQDIPHATEAIGVILKENGQVLEVVPTRVFYRFLAQVNRLTNTGGALESVENTTVDSTQAIASNVAAIDTANTNIAQINADLATLQANLVALSNDVATVSSNLSAHASYTQAHGSNGDVAGLNDLPVTATLTQQGLVKKAQAITAPTFVNLADAQAWADELITSLNDAGVIDV